ncbi:MAG: ABC transporter permease subunit [Oligoflexia bacterium]|nr:ABC transporter permease subunit [Oligoflexia bacterium]
MNAAFLVASNTMREILRDRILYGLILFAIGVVALSVFLGELSLFEQSRIITDFGLVAAQLGCGTLAIFIGSSLVWREIEKQTILTLLSKPVSRSTFIIGKFLGLSCVILLVDVLVSLFLAFICSQYGQVFWTQFIISAFGVFAESLFLLSTAIFFGVFCRPVLTTLFTLSVWLVGHGVNDLHYFSEKSKNVVLKNFGLGFSRIFPNLENFNFKEAVLYGDAITNQTLLNVSSLWLAWIAILLVVSIWIFEKRDFT